MDIYIYNNGQDDFIRIPVIPESVGISSGQKMDDFNTIGQGDIKLIGPLKNQELELEAFFPANFYAFDKNASAAIDAMEYVDKLQSFRESRKPVYVYISDLEFASKCVIESMEYKIKDGSGDIYYKLKMSEYKNIRAASIKKGDGVKTSDSTNVTVSKDGYANATPSMIGNLRTGAGKQYGFAGASLSTQKLRKYRQMGNYIQTNKGWILSSYLKG